MTTEPRGGAELTDDALQDEIELVGDLVVAASASERPLTDAEIDTVLGVTRKHETRREEKRASSRRQRQQA